MPFTFSHPAAILPFRILPKKWISLTGLIVGSMVPDFEKFLKMSPGNSLSHTWEGLFLFNLPLGLLLCFVFHNVVRNSLTCNLPLYFRKRLSYIQPFNWNKYFSKRYAVIIISILIGAVSHIGWDSLTHKRGLVVRLVPRLEQKINIVGIEQPFYGMLDLMSTVLGGLFVFFTIVFLPVRVPADFRSHSRSKYWLMVLLIALAVLSVRTIFGLGKEWYWELAITSLSGLFSEL